MKIYNWSHLVHSGFYADAVLIAVANSVEEARELVKDEIYKYYLNIYNGHQAGKEKIEEWSKSGVEYEAYIFNQEPEVIEPPFVLYQRQVN